MAKQYIMNVSGQSYFSTEAERTFPVVFTVPEQGPDENTGLCLLVAGFAGDIMANVYIKMRNQFAEDYNLIVIQCEYFGYEFMSKETADNLLNDLGNWFTAEEIGYYEKAIIEKPVTIEKSFKLDESPDNFCEMGIFQALDNLRAIKAVQYWIAHEGYTCNTDKIIGYGHSHGAYLLYICNALFPGLFSAIIDNSAWIFPLWLVKPRILLKTWKKNVFLELKLFYQGIQFSQDKMIYLLNTYYSQTVNTCKIYSYHSEKDQLVPLADKQKLLSGIAHSVLHPIGEDDVDGEIFKDLNHGLGADFLKMFDMVYREYHLENADNGGKWNKNTIVTEMYEYKSGIEGGYPFISRRNAGRGED